MIVGLTGPIASGKEVFTELLVEKGFIHLSLSEQVRIEARKRRLPIERKVLQDLGNELRKEHGSGYWANKLLEKVEEGKNYVIDGIRNPGEVEELRKERNFVLIGITAPIEDRIERIRNRTKDSDPKDRESILMIDLRDRGVNELEFGQQSEKCFEMADSIVLNNTTLEDLREKAFDIVNQLIG